VGTKAACFILKVAFQQIGCASPTGSEARKQIESTNFGMFLLKIIVFFKPVPGVLGIDS